MSHNPLSIVVRLRVLPYLHAVVAILVCLLGAMPHAMAQEKKPATQEEKKAPIATGDIEGYVSNTVSGDAMPNVRVRIVGTFMEAVSNEDGIYRIIDVPAGEVSLEASHLGMVTVTEKVTVEANKLVTKDFVIGVGETVRDEKTGKDDIVMLDRYSVKAESMTAQAAALAQQRDADNIKTVMSVESLADMADGNVGEYLKFMPGINMNYGSDEGYSPSTVSLRGMPADKTLVQIDGMESAGIGVVGNSGDRTAGTTDMNDTRAFDFSTTSITNVDRIEVTKAPTPDQPGSSIGGVINIVSKSGFSRRKPLFTYNFFLTHNDGPDGFDPSFRKQAGPDSLSTNRATNLGYEFNYILPIKNKVSFSFAYKRAPRYNTNKALSEFWSQTRLRVFRATAHDYVNYKEPENIKGTFDWKIGRYGTFSLNYQGSDTKSSMRDTAVYFVPTGVTGDRYQMQGAENSYVSQYTRAKEIYQKSNTISAKYKHDGRKWKIDAHISHGWGESETKDVGDNVYGYTYFQLGGTKSGSATGMTMSATGFDELKNGKFPVFTVRNGNGVIIDPYDLSVGDGTYRNSYTLEYGETYAARVESSTDSAGLDIARNFKFFGNIMGIKAGVLVKRMERDQRGGFMRWNARTESTANGGRFTAHPDSGFDLLASGYSERMTFIDANGTPIYGSYMDPSKVYAATLTGRLGTPSGAANLKYASIDITETITSGYIRFNNRFFNNRLKAIYGVRYELTDDFGHGPKAETTGGVTTPLERAYEKDASYDNFFPSINLTYLITPNFILRAAASRSIGRPSLSLIVPSMVISNDPEDEEDDRYGTITVRDGKLKPWTATSYDLSLELYEIKGATATASLFRKEIKNFFWTPPRTRATAADLAEMGLPSEFLGYYIRRMANSGSVTQNGIELSYQQNLWFIPGIGKDLDIYGTYTRLELDGPNENEFAPFSKENVSGGISFSRSRFTVKLSVTYNNWVRGSTYTLSGGDYYPGCFIMNAPATKFDLDLRYKLTKRISLYCSARNLTSEPTRQHIVAPDQYNVPDYATLRTYKFYPAIWTLGIKGSF